MTNKILLIVSIVLIVVSVVAQVIIRFAERESRELMKGAWTDDDGNIAFVKDDYYTLGLNKTGGAYLKINDARAGADGVCTFFLGCTTGFGIALLSVVLYVMCSG